MKYILLALGGALTLFLLYNLYYYFGSNLFHINPPISNITFREVEFDQNCYSFNNLNLRGYLSASERHPALAETQVISNEAQYQILKKYSYCDEPPLPSIDFNSETLLGIYQMSGMCGRATFDKNVVINNESKLLNYFVAVHDKGWFWNTFHNVCRSNSGTYSMNWIAVPAIPSDFQIRLYQGNKVTIFDYDQQNNGWVEVNSGVAGYP